MLENGTRVNNYWCGNGTVIDHYGDYYTIEWDSGLTNDGILGYHRSVLSVIS